jgi:hypothetical protein
MTGVGPPSERQHSSGDDGPSTTPPPTVSPAMERARRLNTGNMLRSMLPLVVICLVIVGWTNFRQSKDAADPVHEVDPSTSVQLAAARASYDLLVPQGLDDGYRATSARTDAGNAAEGDPVTLEIGYLTPRGEYAGFVVSDDRRAEPVATVLDGAQEKGSVDIGGQAWTRAVTDRDETALSREDGDVIVVITGSASDEELETVAAAVRPYSG